MYPTYHIYQAERPKSLAEQQEADRVNAELAAAVAELWRAPAASWRSLRRSLRTWRHPQAPALSRELRLLDSADSWRCLTPDEQHDEMCSVGR